jgi:hypothetical protein
MDARMNWSIPEGRPSLATGHNMDERLEDLAGHQFCGAKCKTNDGCDLHALAGMLGAGDGHGECLGGLTMHLWLRRMRGASACRCGVEHLRHLVCALHVGHAATTSLPHETCTCEMVTSCPDSCRMHVIHAKRLCTSLSLLWKRLALLHRTVYVLVAHICILLVQEVFNRYITVAKCLFVVIAPSV